MKKLLWLLALMIVALSLTACAGNDSATFNGSRTSDDEQFVMEYSILNMTDSRALELEAGDAIHVEIESLAGELDVTIQKGDDEPVYRGVQLPTSTFDVTVSESGTYNITVTGRQAKGSARFEKVGAK